MGRKFTVSKNLVNLSVSIIIPVYNAATSVEITLRSALQQDAERIIVVDNNSTDGSRSIVENKSSHHPGKILVRACSIQGVCSARNTGLASADTEWIQFLDADDTLAPNKVSYQLERVEPDTCWVIGGYAIKGPNGEIDVRPHEDPWKGLVYKYQIGCTHANLYRRIALNQIGGWDEKLPDNEDPNLHFELLKSGLNYQIVPEILSFYHQHPSEERLSQKAPVARNLRRLNLLERVNDYLQVNRKDYWKKNHDYFVAALLRGVRILATYDVSVAIKQYDRLFKARKIKLDLPDQTIIGQGLLQVYRTFGFQKVERVRLAIAPFLPQILKERLKR